MGLYKKSVAAKQDYNMRPPVQGVASLVDGRISLSFFQTIGTITEIKRLSGRKFHNGTWTATLSLDNIDMLENMEFELHGDLISWRNNILVDIEFDPEFKVHGLNHQLDKYQLETVQTIDAWGGRALLADDPGLGKTAEALAWCVHADAFPLLVVCPSFAKDNWKAEIEYWVEEKLMVQIISGNQPVDIYGDIVIVNYDVLAQQEETSGGVIDTVRPDIWDEEWRTVIVDEGHYISNPDSIRSWAVKTFCETLEIPNLLIITATPGKVRPIQLFSLVNQINPKVFPSFFKYGHRFCGPKKGFRGQWDFNGSSNEAELYNLLTKTVMIRHTTEEVYGVNMKKLRRIPVLLPGYTDEYNSETWNPFNLEKLKQDAARAKMPAVFDWLDNLLLQVDKVIVFAHHKEIITMLRERYHDIAVVVDGGTSDKEKEEAKDKFQRCVHCGIRKERHKNVPCPKYEHDLSTRMFIGSSAAKEAATLTAAYDVVFLELWWSMYDHQQGEGRAHMRKSDPHGINAWYLLAANSIEEDIADIISFRSQKMSMVMNGKPINKELLLSSLIRRQCRV